MKGWSLTFSYVPYFQDLRAEIDAHTDILRSLRENGASMLTTLETAEDRRRTEEQLARMNERWDALLARSRSVRKRLETAQEQWEQLTSQLQDSIFWVETKNKALLNEQPVGGDLKTVQKQQEFIVVSALIQDRHVLTMTIDASLF